MLKGFISYAHEDYSLCQKLHQHLQSPRISSHLDCWIDHCRIKAGAGWNAAIETALGEAQVFLMLISSASFASEYIRDVEWPGLFRPCPNVSHTEMTALLCYSAANRPRRPSIQRGDPNTPSSRAGT